MLKAYLPVASNTQFPLQNAVGRNKIQIHIYTTADQICYDVLAKHRQKLNCLIWPNELHFVQLRCTKLNNKTLDKEQTQYNIEKVLLQKKGRW